MTTQRDLKVDIGFLWTVLNDKTRMLSIIKLLGFFEWALTDPTFFVKNAKIRDP